MRWYVRATIVFTLLETALLAYFSPSILERVAWSPNLLVVLVQMPLIVLGILNVPFVYRNRFFLFVCLLWVVMAVSLFWSADAFWLGICRVYLTLEVICWGVVIARYKESLIVISSALQKYLVVACVLNLFVLEKKDYLPVNSALVITALFSHLLVQRDKDFGKNLLSGLYYVFCFALVVMGTLRAIMIACAIGLLIASWRQILSVRLSAAALLLFLIVLIPLVLESRTVDPLLVDRSDIVARVSAIKGDQLSGRGEIWPALINEISVQPTWLWFGLGVGGPDREIYNLTHFWNSELGSDGIWRTNAHNIVLELVMSIGLVGTIPFICICFESGLLLWRTRNISAAGLAITVSIASLANVIFYDANGGVLLSGLFLGSILMISNSAKRAPAPEPRNELKFYDGRAVAAFY